MSRPEAKGIVGRVGGIEKEGEFIDANGVGVRGGFSEELYSVVKGMGGAKDVMSVLLSGGWEKGSLSDWEGEELIIQGDGVGLKHGEEL